jgi:hypothetical protein
MQVKIINKSFVLINGGSMEKKYIIYNFINEYLEGYFDSGMPSLTCLKDSALKLKLKDAERHLSKLHKMGFTGLKIKEYNAGLYD